MSDKNQCNHNEGSFKGQKVKNDKPLPAYAHADKYNKPSERPKNDG